MVGRPEKGSLVKSQLSIYRIVDRQFYETLESNVMYQQAGGANLNLLANKIWQMNSKESIDLMKQFFDDVPDC